jgi:hypothetical protein
MFETIIDKVNKAAKEKKERKKNSLYWMICPNCGREVVKKELKKKGCFICGYKSVQSSAFKEQSTMGSYKIICPACESKVVRSELEKKGCYVCGYKP